MIGLKYFVQVIKHVYKFDTDLNNLRSRLGVVGSYKVMVEWNHQKV